MTKAKASASTTATAGTSQAPDDFAPIPIRRAGPSRSMPMASAALNAGGALVLVFSPAFMAEHRPPPSVLVSWSPTTRTLRLTPAGQAGARKIRARPSCPGAGELRLSALSLANLQNFPALNGKRRALAVSAVGETILIDFTAKANEHE